MSDQKLAEFVRGAIENEQRRRGVTTNRDLAKELGIYSKHLSHWQNGRFTRLDRVLIEIIMANAAPVHPAA